MQIHDKVNNLYKWVGGEVRMVASIVTLRNYTHFQWQIAPNGIDNKLLGIDNFDKRTIALTQGFVDFMVIGATGMKILDGLGGVHEFIVGRTQFDLSNILFQKLWERVD